MSNQSCILLKKCKANYLGIETMPKFLIRWLQMQLKKGVLVDLPITILNQGRKCQILFGSGLSRLVPYQSFSCFLCKKIVFERNLETQKAEQFFIVRLAGSVLCNRFKKDPRLVGLISYVKKMTDYIKLLGWSTIT